MKVVFVYWAMEDQGSGLVIQGYTEAARALGHDVRVYGRWIPGKINPVIPLAYSIDLEAADAVVFIFEWTVRLKPGDQLDLTRLVSRIPRNRRVIVDGDGNYNDIIRVSDDYNHADADACKRWIEVCDSLSDKICQPTMHPVRSKVIPFLFYAYNPLWERRKQADRKEFDIIYIGHSKFRWGPMVQVLRGIGPIRGNLGRIGLVGYGWDSEPHWANSYNLQQAYFSDHGKLKSLNVESLPPVRFQHVIDWMSKGRINPILLRPLFEHLHMVTPRLFETLAADTIPLLVLDPRHAREIYGDVSLELILPATDPHEKILDMVYNPKHYHSLVSEVRRQLSERHSHAARLRQLIEIIES